MKESILEKLDVDFRGVVPNVGRKSPVLKNSDNGQYFVDEWGMKWEMPSGALYFSVASYPFAGDITEKDIENFNWPDPTDPALFEGLEEKAKRYHQQGYAVILEGICSGIFESSCRMRGTEQFYMDLAMNPGIACRLLDKLVELKIEFYKQASKRLGKYIQFVREVDDVAGQEALLVSPQMYRDIIKPRHKQLFDAQRQIFPEPFYIWFHSDGAILDIIPDFIEMGVDVLNPVQLTAKGMDAEKLKAQFGKDLSFWGGGVNTQSVLPHASPDEVKHDVRERIQHLARGGGFIFGTVHNIQDDVPVENIIAMLDEFRALRDY